MSMPNGPDGINPAAEFGVSGTGISGLPNRTQPNIVELLKQSKFPASSPWKNPAGMLAAGWNSILSAIGGAATNAVNALTQIAALIAGVGGTVIGHVVDFLNAAGANAATAIANASAAWANLQATLNAIKRGWSGIPDAEGSIEDVEVILGATRQVQYGLITVADLAAAPRNVAGWVSPNPVEEVSFPRFALETVINYGTSGTTAEMDQSGTTIPLAGSWGGGTASDLNNHSHNFTITATEERPRYQIAAGTMALAWVRIPQDRLINTVRFFAGGDTPPADLFVGLYKIDTTTGARTLIYDFGDVSGEVDTGPSAIFECTLEMSEDMMIDAGTELEVGILPVGGSYAVAGIRRTVMVPSPIIYPQASTELLAGQAVLPASITETALNHTSTHRVWASVGQALPETITPVTLIIDFDAYTATGNWVSPAVKNFGTSNALWRISDGVLYASGPATLGPSNYNKAFMPLQRCATDNMYAEIVIGSGWTGADSGERDRAYVRCNPEGTAAVEMEIHQDGTGPATITISTVDNLLGVGGTTRATSSAPLQANLGDRIRITAVHDEVAGYSTFTCLHNGDPIPGAEWADTGNVAARGVAWRRAAYSSSCASYSNQVYRAAGIDVFRAGDLALA